MKNLVKDLINTVNNHKVFFSVLVAATVAAGILQGIGATFVMLFCLSGIRVVVFAWKSGKKREKEKFLWKIFFLALIIFLHGPIVSMITKLITNAFWHKVLMEYVSRGIFLVTIGLFGFLAVCLCGIGMYTVWKKLARWDFMF